jgi:hypothetical protein
MKLLNIETPVTRNFIPQILLNVQDFYFHKFGYASYDEGVFGTRQSLSVLPFRLTSLSIFFFSERDASHLHWLEF